MKDDNEELIYINQNAKGPAVKFTYVDPFNPTTGKNIMALTLEDYSIMVHQLAKSGKDIAKQMTPFDAHGLHMAIGISGEAGELLDAVKKTVIYRKPLDRDNVIEELGDLEFYMEGIRQGYNITRDETLQANINKLSERYKGLNYSDKQAQDRADKA